MQPVKPAKESNFMWSVTRSNNMKSIEPDMVQSSKKQHIYEECSVKSVCYDKNCQDTKFKWPVKPASDMQSMEPAVQSSFKKKH